WRAGDFNPTRVRLKPAGYRSTKASSYFNPTRVRLKLALLTVWWTAGIDFNPTRVRLKPEFIGFAQWRGSASTRYFNPTRVRLKPSVARRSSPSPFVLQPHKGSSETSSFTSSSASVASL